MGDPPPERNRLGEPLKSPMVCGACGGTGKSTAAGGPSYGRECQLCKGSGVLLPEPRPEPEPGP